ncbi:MAG TPA: hypothetical protein VGM81_17265 [Burkholderiaceae bacterium]
MKTETASNVLNTTLDGVKPMLDRAVDQAAAMAQRGADAVREQARNASDSTVTYIRAEPVKAVLIAAATGAALVTMISFFTRSRRQD